jgi:hypothetical protein
VKKLVPSQKAYISRTLKMTKDEEQNKTKK